MKIASLAMYDFPVNTSAWLDLWKRIVKRLNEVDFPDKDQIPLYLESLQTFPISSLEQAGREGKLFLGMVCGLHFAKANMVQGLLPAYQYVGNFVYDCEGTTIGFYSSLLITRQGYRLPPYQDVAFSNIKIAVNELNSYSGFITLVKYLRNQGVLLTQDSHQIQITGSHANSVNFVISGNADFAAIDAVSYAWICTQYPDLANQISIVASTDLMPGLPLVTHCAMPFEQLHLLRQSIDYVVSAPENQNLCQFLKIKGMRYLDSALYQQCLPQ